MPRLDLTGSGERSYSVEGGRFGKAPTEKRHTTRRPLGSIVITDPDAPGEEYDTLMCVHCQYHWKVIPGSGRRRGFCLRCLGPTCGKKPCETGCTPFEKGIELMESKAQFHRAVARVL